MPVTLPTHRLLRDYGGHAIYLRNPGFEFTPVTLRKIASFVVAENNRTLAVFAFAYSMLVGLEGGGTEEEPLLADALAVVEKRIDAGEIKHHGDYTYELQGGAFVEVRDPKWWISSFA